MTKVQTIIEHAGIEYPAEVMTIQRTTLGLEDHGVWTAYLHCEGNSSGIGVGGYFLDNRPADSPLADKGRRTGRAFGMDQIMMLTKTVGVNKWEDLPGRKVFVLFDRNRMTAVGIANVDTGAVFDLKDHAQKWRDATES